MRKYLYLILLPLIFAACDGRRTTTTTTTDPVTGQQTTTTTVENDYSSNYASNQSYSVYTDAAGTQYAVTYINGQQMYIPYNIFQQQLAIGGYAALNDYYYTNPNYFNVYTGVLTGWAISNALSGTYGNYYNNNRITNYKSYTPRHRETVSGTNNNNSYRNTTRQERPSETGMGNRSNNQSSYRRNDKPSETGMGNRNNNSYRRQDPPPSPTGMGTRQEPQRQQYVRETRQETRRETSTGMGTRRESSSSSSGSGMGTRRESSSSSSGSGMGTRRESSSSSSGSGMGRRK